MPQNLKLSEIKTNITTVLANLQQLETSSISADQSAELQQSTTALLSHLEQLPAEHIRRLQLQRQRRRQRAKRVGKQQKRINRAYAKRFKDTKVISQVCSNAAQQPQTATKAAQHITLNKLHDANNKLRTFDLLERLYKARGGEYDLTAKLSRMRTVWRRVKQECENATGAGQAAPVNLEAQWDEVLFGTSCGASKQQSRGQKKQKIQQLLQCRFVWDSYLSSASNDASSIPSGWVLPPKNPSPDWAEFRCE